MSFVGKSKKAWEKNLREIDEVVSVNVDIVNWSYYCKLVLLSYCPTADLITRAGIKERTCLNSRYPKIILISK